MKRPLLFFLLAVLLVASCSTKKNTASSRKWQAFVTRYNVYFNAEQAYLEGRSAQDKGLKENYTDLLPMFGVGYEKQRSLGKSNFETSVTKCEKESLLSAVSKDIEYYDDEELDRFARRSAEDYSAEEVEEFEEILSTLRSDEVAGWVRSLQLRSIELPIPLRDEVIMIVGERR